MENIKDNFEKHFNKKVEFTKHALYRGEQIGFNEQELRDMLCFARKTKQRGRERVYEHGGTQFFCAFYKERIVVKTVWDENIPRNIYT